MNTKSNNNDTGFWVKTDARGMNTNTSERAVDHGVDDKGNVYVLVEKQDQGKKSYYVAKHRPCGLYVQTFAVVDYVDCMQKNPLSVQPNGDVFVLGTSMTDYMRITTLTKYPAQSSRQWRVYGTNDYNAQFVVDAQGRSHLVTMVVENDERGTCWKTFNHEGVALPPVWVNTSKTRIYNDDRSYVPKSLHALHIDKVNNLVFTFDVLSERGMDQHVIQIDLDEEDSRTNHHKFDRFSLGRNPYSFVGVANNTTPNSVDAVKDTVQQCIVVTQTEKENPTTRTTIFVGQTAFTIDYILMADKGGCYVFATLEGLRNTLLIVKIGRRGDVTYMRHYTSNTDQELLEYRVTVRNDIFYISGCVADLQGGGFRPFIMQLPEDRIGSDEFCTVRNTMLLCTTKEY